jgi:hypothetical protein
VVSFTIDAGSIRNLTGSDRRDLRAAGDTISRLAKKGARIAARSAAVTWHGEPVSEAQAREFLAAVKQHYREEHMRMAQLLDQL